MVRDQIEENIEAQNESFATCTKQIISFDGIGSVDFFEAKDSAWAMVISNEISEKKVIARLCSKYFIRYKKETNSICIQGI